MRSALKAASTGFALSIILLSFATAASAKARSKSPAGAPAPRPDSANPSWSTPWAANRSGRCLTWGTSENPDGPCRARQADSSAFRPCGPDLMN